MADPVTPRKTIALSSCWGIDNPHIVEMDSSKVTVRVDGKYRASVSGGSVMSSSEATGKVATNRGFGYGIGNDGDVFGGKGTERAAVNGGTIDRGEVHFGVTESGAEKGKGSSDDPSDTFTIPDGTTDYGAGEGGVIAGRSNGDGAGAKYDMTLTAQIKKVIDAKDEEISSAKIDLARLARAYVQAKENSADVRSTILEHLSDARAELAATNTSLVNKQWECNHLYNELIHTKDQLESAKKTNDRLSQDIASHHVVSTRADDDGSPVNSRRPVASTVEHVGTSRWHETTIFLGISGPDASTDVSTATLVHADMKTSADPAIAISFRDQQRRHDPH